MKKYLRQKANILRHVELYQSELDAIKQKGKDLLKWIDISLSRFRPDTLLFFGVRQIPRVTEL